MLRLNLQHGDLDVSAEPQPVPISAPFSVRAIPPVTAIDSVCKPMLQQNSLLQHGQIFLANARARVTEPHALRTWQPAGTVVAVLLALLLTWHVVNGKDGLSSWHQKRTEDHQLQTEINSLESENEHLRDRISSLKSDPEAIEREARETLHYAKPGEVIYALPAPTAQPSGAEK